MVPPFNFDGNLPEGIHDATWEEFCQRFGHNEYRRMQLQGMKEALDNLRAAGCKRVYIDGSFVTSKEFPNDYDGCWEEHGVNPLLLDGTFLDFSNKRAAQKVRYSGELFPASMAGDISGRRFREFFQQDRDGSSKGIVSIDLGVLP